MNSDRDPRVLIVESNDALRVLLFTILRHQPLGVDTASTVDEAMAKVASCDYALIIVDADMEEKAAVTFLENFRAERPEATSFILAVRDPNNDIFLDPELFSAVLNKPLEIDTMAELVRECAQVVPRPDDPLPCPPSESEIRSRLERAPYMAN